MMKYYLKKLIVKEENNILLEKKLKTTPKNSTIEMVIFFKVKEDITGYQNIEEVR